MAKKEFEMDKIIEVGITTDKKTAFVDNVPVAAEYSKLGKAVMAALEIEKPPRKPRKAKDGAELPGEPDLTDLGEPRNKKFNKK